MFQRVARQERFKTSLSIFLGGTEKTHVRNDPEKEMGLKRYFLAPENAHSIQRPETL